MAENINELFNDDQIKQLDELLEKYKDKPGSLIPVLEHSQQLLGYLPICVQDKIAKELKLPANRVYGVVTFYSFFTMEPKARHRVQVCAGTACYVKGGKEIAEKIEKEYNISFGQSTPDGRFTFEKTRCFGACGLAPVVVVDGKVYGKVTPESIVEILKQYK